jgi:hypothetical protein
MSRGRFRVKSTLDTGGRIFVPLLKRTSGCLVLPGRSLVALELRPLPPPSPCSRRVVIGAASGPIVADPFRPSTLPIRLFGGHANVEKS